MTFDFDRYLLASDPVGLDPLLIQKAYSEWTSYCYMAYNMCSDVERSLSNPPAVVNARPNNCTPRSASHNRPLSRNRADDNRITTSGRSLVDNSRNKTYVRDDPAIRDDIVLRRTGENCSTAAQSRELQRHLAHGTTQDSHHLSYTESDHSDVRHDFVECYRCDSDRTGDSASMPRPPGYEFGSRLSWVQSHGNVRSNHVLPGVTSSFRTTPALGVSGLKCQGTKNDVLNRSPKRGIETFPKCATFRIRTSTEVSRYSANDHVANRRSGIQTCREFSENLRELSVTQRSSEVTTTTIKQTSIVTSSAVVLTSIDDVIDEYSSSDEEVQTVNTLPTSPETETQPQRTRKVTFADERGEALVMCRIYEREESPMRTYVTTPLDCDVRSDAPGDGSDDTDDDTDEHVNFNILAEAATNTVSRDIDNLKN